MDFSKLGQNEKLAAYGAIASIAGMLIASFLAGIGWVTLLAGFAMLVVILLPQFSATALPGSKGSLMVAVGGVGAVAAVLALLTTLAGLGSYLSAWPLNTLSLIVGVVGGLLMGWAGWQEFQAEGGKFQLGNATTPAATGADRDLSSAARDVPPATSAPVGTDAPVVDTTDEDRNRI